MTREEAKDLLDNLIGMVEDNHDSDYDTALQMAIKALEAWGKVIEEIESQQEFNIACDGESDLGIAIQIIKEHLGESEERNK